MFSLQHAPCKVKTVDKIKRIFFSLLTNNGTVFMTTLCMKTNLHGKMNEWYSTAYTPNVEWNNFRPHSKNFTLPDFMWKTSESWSVWYRLLHWFGFPSAYCVPDWRHCTTNYVTDLCIHANSYQHIHNLPISWLDFCLHVFISTIFFYYFEKAKTSIIPLLMYSF